jgi:hypothetical protein
MNTVQVTDDGRGDVQMGWNGGQFHPFTGVTTAIIQAQRARTDQFTFQFSDGSDTVSARATTAGSTFQQPGPSTDSAGIELGSHRQAESVSAKAAGYPLDHLHIEHSGLIIEADTELTAAADETHHTEDKTNIEKHGFAVQNGTELTITVNRPTSTSCRSAPPSREPAGARSRWNGRVVRSSRSPASRPSSSIPGTPGTTGSPCRGRGLRGAQGPELVVESRAASQFSHRAR